MSSWTFPVCCIVWGLEPAMKNVPKQATLAPEYVLVTQNRQNWTSFIWLVVEPYPSEKWWSESQLGWWHSQYMEKIIQMFQTTNQYNIYIYIIYIHECIIISWIFMDHICENDSFDFICRIWWLCTKFDVFWPTTNWNHKPNYHPPLATTEAMSLTRKQLNGGCNSKIIHKSGEKIHRIVLVNLFRKRHV